MARITRTWQDAEISELRRRHASGETTVEIAAALGRTADSVRGRLCWEAEKGTAPPVAKAEVEAIKASGQAAEIERLRATIEKLNRGPERLPVVCNAKPKKPVEERWLDVERENSERIERFFERTQFRLELEDKKPVALAFIGDQHIARGKVDFRRMREDAQLIAETDGLYAILGGDSCDNHVKHSAAILAQELQPDEQWEFFEWYLSIFSDSIVCLINGNHDHWTDQKAGIDIVGRIARSQHLCYAPHEARVTMPLGGYPYKIATRHQYRYNSSLNLLHSVKRWYDMGEETFDVGALHHLHESETGSFRRHGQDCWACRTGSYKISDDYSWQIGFNSTRPSAPTFIFYPGERRILGFRDLRDGVETLKAVRR